LTKAGGETKTKPKTYGLDRGTEKRLVLLENNPGGGRHFLGGGGFKYVNMAQKEGVQVAADEEKYYDC